MKEYAAADIRNIALVAHGGTGKTSLAEAMIWLTGATSRHGRVEDGNTVSDYDPDEVKRKSSVNLALIPCEWNGNKINVVDTPGYADFVGEVKAGLRAVDSAVIVLDGQAGVQVGTEFAWNFADERAMPRLAFINRLDRENSSFQAALDSLCQHYGSKCVAITIPIGTEDSLQGVVDIIKGVARLGEKGAEGPIPEGMTAEVTAAREKLVEAVAETDDDLINKYLEGEEISVEEICASLKRAVINGQVVDLSRERGLAAPYNESLCAVLRLRESRFG